MRIYEKLKLGPIHITAAVLEHSGVLGRRRLRSYLRGD